MKTMLVVLGLSAAALLVNAPASAAPKSKSVCTTAWWQACTKQCTQRGGQVRICPEYCKGRQRDQGCNV